MSYKLSIKNNQKLLEERSSTLLRRGAKLSLEQEKHTLKRYESSYSFIGIIPLHCNLGDYYYLSLNDDHVASYLFQFGSFGYERSSAVLFTHLSMKASYVVDMGSYSGYYSILSSVLAKNNKTYAVEANPLNFHRLQENLRINNSRAIACNRALIPSIDDTLTVSIFYNSALKVLDTGSFADHESAEIISQKISKKDTFTISAISFPELCSYFSLPIVEGGNSYALLKLDVEGLEIPLLKDIIKFYEKSGFVVFVEILTASAFKQIFSLIQLNPNLGIAYIEEYEQSVVICDSPVYPRKQGSRNFVIADKFLLASICDYSLNSLLLKYE